MKAAYGIFTTDGETVAGTLHDEYAVRLAERLDESTASLYVSTTNGVFLLGTAVNVQKSGRRPDTVIYLEKYGWNHAPLPEIDLAFIRDFYRRVRARLSASDYVVRDATSGDVFPAEPNTRTITALPGTDAVDYTIGRLLLGKEVVCVGADRTKSVGFVVAVTERLHSLLSPGFTIVVAKRTFRGADLLVTEKYSGTAHITLATEQTDDTRWGDIYRSMGVLARNPIIRQKITKERTRHDLAAELITEYRHHIQTDRTKTARFETFLTEEDVGVSGTAPEAFSPAAYEPPDTTDAKRPDESDYDMRVQDDREHLRLERGYEEQMRQKKKARTRLIAVLVVFFLLCAAVLVLFVLYPASIPIRGGEPDIPRFTPSATIAPVNETVLVTRLNTTPGNIPENLSGIGSAYEVTVSGPRNVTMAVPAPFRPDASYFLMRYNESGSAWEDVNTTVLVSNVSASALIPDSGIYRLFTEKEGRVPAGGGDGSAPVNDTPG